jgi:ADP-ribosylation factor family
LKKVKQRERELRILILGLDNAGKTTGDNDSRSSRITFSAMLTRNI